MTAPPEGTDEWMADRPTIDVDLRGLDSVADADLVDAVYRASYGRWIDEERAEWYRRAVGYGRAHLLRCVVAVST